MSVTIYILEFEVIRGPKRQAPIVHLGRTEPPIENVLREVDTRIQESEEGCRDLVALHRRRVRLLHEVKARGADMIESVLKLARKYMLESGEPVDCALYDVFEIAPEDAIACLKKAHSRAKAAKSRKARKDSEHSKIVDRLKNKLSDMRKRDPLPTLVCDVIDGLHGDKARATCEKLLSELPTDEEDEILCGYCSQEVELRFSAEKGWYRVPAKAGAFGRVICEACDKEDNPLFSCDDCGAGYPEDEITMDFDGACVCSLCLDEPDRIEAREEAESEELEEIRREIHRPNF